MEQRELMIASSVDGSAEKSLFCPVDEPGPRPLLVGLHTWSCDRFNQVEHMAPLCRERGWALLLPEFRGPNLVQNPRAGEACASHRAKQDILDAVEHVIALGGVDLDHIFLLGGSGGGHMALMMAAYAPERWAAVSSWVPITDLASWHAQNRNYASHIRACCGGPPGFSPAVDEEYRLRSPMSYIDAIAQANVSVHHGRYDPSVPYTHTWKLAQAVERHGADRFFCEIFDGGHELRYPNAFAWFDTILTAHNQGPAALSS